MSSSAVALPLSGGPLPILPNEIKALIFSYCDPAALAAICCTSFQSLALAAPLLYTDIELRTVEQAQLLFCNLVEGERSAPISDLLSLAQIRTVRSLIPNSKDEQGWLYFSRDRLPGGAALPIDRLDLTPGQSRYSESDVHSAPDFSRQLANLFDPVAVHASGPANLDFDLDICEMLVSLGMGWSRLRHLSFKNSYPPYDLNELPIVQDRGTRPLHIEYDLSAASVSVSTLLEDLGYGDVNGLKDVSLPLKDGMSVVLKLEATSISELEDHVGKDAPGWSRIRFEIKEASGQAAAQSTP